MSTRPGAIFDLDGTLLDSWVVWNHLAAWLLGTQGLAAPPGLQHEVAAMSLAEAVDYLKAQYGLRGETSALVEACNGHVRAAYEHTLLPMPGAAAYVARLQRQGVRLCVATASDASLARAALARLGMLPAFSFLLTEAEVGRSKRHPDIYLAAARRLGLPPAQCTVYEDAPHAIATARRAGFPVVEVGLGGFVRHLEAQP